jgi:hypothetical protein
MNGSPITCASSGTARSPHASAAFTRISTRIRYTRPNRPVGRTKSTSAIRM